MRCWLVLLALCASAMAGEDASALRLVPFPKQVTMGQGTFGLGREAVLQAPRHLPAKMVMDLTSTLGKPGLRLRVGVLAGEGHALRIGRKAVTELPAVAFRKEATEEDYVLRVEPDAISIGGKGPAGLFYGVQTLLQLIRANRRDGGIPCLTIRDWPSIRWRCFQDDLTRGPSTKLSELQRMLGMGAGLKMNLFTYYMEHQFAWKKHPLLGPKDGSLTPQELKALVEAGKRLHLDILGNQQSFGHFHHILKHDEYKHLRETGGILCPVKEESYRLLDDLYSEVIPHLPFPFFNVCCDETHGLGRGPSKPLAEKIGVGGVYARHLRRIHDLLKEKYGKRMMMWGDIILRHPDHLKEIPTDTIMLTWGYSARPSFEHQILPFAKSGYEFFVCPGVSCWSRILPDFGVAATNIRNFVRDGAKHGALGVLNTAWDDDGENFNAPNWHGYAWGAECSWNASKTPYEDFNRRIGAVLFGEKGDHFGQAIGLLQQTHRLPGMLGMNDRRFWQNDLGPSKVSAKADRAAAEKLLAIVRPAIKHLEACREEATANADLLDYFLFGARRMELIGQRSLDRLEAVALYRTAYESPTADAAAPLAKAQALIVGNRDAHAAIARRYQALWHRENKPHALDRILARYQGAIARYDVLAKRLAAIRTAAVAGKPLPSPGKVGLGIVELGARRTLAQRVVQAPLKADAPWAEPRASHRIGLVVAAGKADRCDVPIELTLAVPNDLASRPIRAFRLGDDGQPREVLAQLDPADKPGRRQLVLLLDGPLPKGKTAMVHVYLGLPTREPGPPSPRFARTSDGPKGMKWLENDQVRLLLGPEGAHLYRWEIKALGSRDVTMPGQTTYYGFADVGGQHRSAANTLVCTAHGPALVRYVCTDEHGLEKTISFFGGAPWVEVTLNAPVRYFWAFDSPQNFAGDGPTPGRYLFSTGATGAVGKHADGVGAQVKADGAQWGAKFIAGTLALAMLTPDVKARHVIAPGGGAGGVGIEGRETASHFVIYAGTLAGEPADLMNRLQRTLDFRNQPEVTLHRIQAK